MARKLPRLAALATTFLLAASGGETLAQTAPVDVLAGAGTFDADVWKFQGPDGATFTRQACEGFTGTCARIAGKDLGERTFDAQLVYWNGAIPRPRFFSLQEGKQYRIQLRGSASSARKTIQVALENSIYQVLGAATFTLGKSPAALTAAPIVIPAGGGGSVTVRVNVGGAANAGVTFSLDDLVVLEEDAGPVDPSGTNLLAQGDFEASPGASVWNRWANDGADVTFSIEDCSARGFTGKCFRASGTSFGTNPWSTQLVKWDGSAKAVLSLDAANQYTFKFVGRSEVAGGVVQLMLQRPDDSATGMISHDFILTTAATPYTFSVPVTASDALSFKLNFLKGAGIPAGTTQIIEIDDLQLLEKAPTP